MYPSRAPKSADRESTRWFTGGTFFCIHCGSRMLPSSIVSQGIRIPTKRCPKDGEEILEPEGTQRALVLNKLRRGIEVKVGELMGAPYVRLTKDFGELVHKGDSASLTLIGPDEIRIQVKHTHPARR